MTDKSLIEAARALVSGWGPDPAHRRFYTAKIVDFAEQHASSVVADREARIAELEAALEHYADEGNWTWHPDDLKETLEAINELPDGKGIFWDKLTAGRSVCSTDALKALAALARDEKLSIDEWEDLIRKRLEKTAYSQSDKEELLIPIMAQFAFDMGLARDDKAVVIEKPCCDELTCSRTDQIARLEAALREARVTICELGGQQAMSDPWYHDTLAKIDAILNPTRMEDTQK